MLGKVLDTLWRSEFVVERGACPVSAVQRARLKSRFPAAATALQTPNHLRDVRLHYSHLVHTVFASRRRFENSTYSPTPPRPNLRPPISQEPRFYAARHLHTTMMGYQRNVDHHLPTATSSKSMSTTSQFRATAPVFPDERRCWHHV